MAKWSADLQFYTIGYEGADLFDFLATLKHAEVSLLVDIRELPASRRKGFSKNALRENLESVGIQYIHLRDLGDPKEGRLAARMGKFNDFRRIFYNHMNKEEAKNGIIEVLELINNYIVCLLCYERSPNNCHRSIVSEFIIKESGAKANHIGVRAGFAEESRERISAG